MKKILVVLAVFAITIAINSFSRIRSNNSTGFTRPWSVSSYGFLIFPSVLDVDAFVQFAQTKTHAEIQQYIIDSLTGFSSLGLTLFSETETMVSEEEAYSYALNTDQIIQASGVIIKPVSERECTVNYEYILTLTPNNLNSTTYASLQNGTFDNNTMNKFATNPATETTTLAQFVTLTPNGHQDTESPDCPDEHLPIAKKIGSNEYYGSKNVSLSNMASEHAGPMAHEYYEKKPANNFLARPFWGWGSESCVQDGEWFNAQTSQWVPRYSRCQTYYIFWIGVNTDCYFAYGCSGCPAHGPCNQQ